MSGTLADLAARLSARLAPEADRFRRRKVFVYDPTVYARETHLDYLAKYASTPGVALLLGMNPGPWGMAQTGVPFGAVPWARWLGVKGGIRQPERPHPLMPVHGWDCQRVEVSGDRLWGLLAGLFGTRAGIRRKVAVLNYCPLLLFEQGARRCRNLALDKLGVGAGRLLAACDGHLAAAIEEIRPSVAVGVGAWAERRLRAAAPAGLEIGRILHPSPASPAANRGFAESARKQLRSLGLAPAA